MDPIFMDNWATLEKFVPTTHKDTYPAISPSLSAASLAGKSVFITGASRGIGRATALSFARAGVTRIAVSARSDLSETVAAIHEAAVAAVPVQVVAINADVSTESGAAEMADRIREAFGGRLDVLVNNAGLVHRAAIMHETEPGPYWKTYEVNVRGTYLITRALVPLMRGGRGAGNGNDETKGGIVLNVSSAGAHMLMYGVSGYQTSKTAVTRLTEFWASEYGQDEKEPIFLSLNPGTVLTDLVKDVAEDRKKHFDETPELAGDGMVWLARERRPWLNGRFVSTTWDVEELEGRKEEIVERDLLKFRVAV